VVRLPRLTAVFAFSVPARVLAPVLSDDVLADIGKDDHLSNLVTALCETEMPKPAKKEKRVVRAQNLDWVKRQLDFVYSCGVEMKLKPSQENIFVRSCVHTSLCEFGGLWRVCSLLFTHHFARRCWALQNSAK
jgi:hypothetical protein